MPAIAIDNITLDVPGMSELQAHRLVLGIGSHLASAGVSGIERSIGTLNIEFTAIADGNVDRLARRIAADIVRQIRSVP